MIVELLCARYVPRRVYCRCNVALCSNTGAPRANNVGAGCAYVFGALRSNLGVRTRDTGVGVVVAVKHRCAGVVRRTCRVCLDLRVVPTARAYGPQCEGAKAWNVCKHIRLPSRFVPRHATTHACAANLRRTHPLFDCERFQWFELSFVSNFSLLYLRRRRTWCHVKRVWHPGLRHREDESGSKWRVASRTLPSIGLRRPSDPPMHLGKAPRASAPFSREATALPSERGVVPDRLHVRGRAGNQVSGQARGCRRLTCASSGLNRRRIGGARARLPVRSLIRSPPPPGAAGRREPA